MLLSPSIETILLNITNRCNLECKHCYVNSSPNGELGQNDEVWLRLVEELSNIYPGVTLAISGGEPLTRMYLVEKLMAASQSRLNPFILTNGHYFNQRFFRSIADYNPKIRISIDGGTETAHDFIRGKGAFNRTIKGIENLLAHNYDMSKVEIFSTLRPQHEADFHSILDICQKYSIRKIKVEPIAKTGRAEIFWPKEKDGNYNDKDHDTFSKFFEKEKFVNWAIKDYEDMKFSSLTVYSNGDIYPFVYYNEDDKKSALLGNIKNTSLSDILNKEKIHKAIISKIFTAHRGGRRGLKSKILERTSSRE